MEELIHPQIRVLEFAFVILPILRCDFFHSTPDLAPVARTVIALQSVAFEGLDVKSHMRNLGGERSALAADRDGSYLGGNCIKRFKKRCSFIQINAMVFGFKGFLHEQEQIIRKVLGNTHLSYSFIS